MLTTIEIVHQIQKSNQNCSKYRVAKLLGVSTGSLSKWTISNGTMDDKIALRAASILNIDPKYLVACVNAERHKGKETYTVWKHICRTIEDENTRRETLKH